MIPQAQAKPGIFDPPPPAPKKKRNYKRLGILAAIIALLGAAGWYYFFGTKPKVALSIPLKAGELSAHRLWAVGPEQMVFLANGMVTLVDLDARKQKWSVPAPAQPEVDATWQAVVNARFVKLQQWADELGRRRVSLTTPKAIKEFNAEAAKYHAELTAARAEAAKSQTPKPPSPEVKATPKPQAAPAGDVVAKDQLKQVVDPGIQILEDRVKKRGAKLEAWKKTLDAKKTAAKTPLQKSAAAEDEARYSAEAAALKEDQDALVRRKGGPAPAEAAAPEPDAAPAMEPTPSDPQIAVCGDQVWLIEGRQAVAFDRASGTVRNVVRLAGPALQVFAGKGAAVIVAHAGPDAVQVTKLTASSPPQSLYLSTPAAESQDQRTEFSSGGDSLLRADIVMKQAVFKTRDAIKPSSEKELESAASNAAAHSTDEIKAMTALLANDAQRANGEHRKRVDESTYQVTLRRPFDSTAPAWTGTLQGRVQVFSTPTLDLVTAGTKLLAFDRSNRKLWEATLGAPVPIRERGTASDHLPPPWLESGERLFFADGAFLTALQPKTGAVLWRLPSVGIRKLQTDADGSLYALSDNLRVEALAYAADASLQDTVPVTMKISPADGKIAWQVEKYSDLWVSGKDVYVLRETRAGQDIENQVFDPAKAVAARMKIYKLGRNKGRPLWEWFQPRAALAVEADGKHVAILFGDEFQLIHSISW